MTRRIGLFYLGVQTQRAIYMNYLDHTISNLGNTVHSRYLEIEGTLKNTSRYQYFDISDL